MTENDAKEAEMYTDWLLEDTAEPYGIWCRNRGVEELRNRTIWNLADYELQVAPLDWESKADKKEASTICGTIEECCKAITEIAERIKNGDNGENKPDRKTGQTDRGANGHNRKCGRILGRPGNRKDNG